MGSCLPREDFQILFIFLEMFRREWTGNDGSWSPGEIVASKEDAGRWNGDWGKEKREKKGDMTGNTGKREKRQSFDPGREWLIMHMQTLSIPHINRNLFFPTPHQNWDSKWNEFVKSVNKCMQTYAHVQRFKYIININVVLLYHVSYFSAVHESPFTALGAAVPLMWSALTCALVSVGSKQWAGLCCHEWWC